MTRQNGPIIANVDRIAIVATAAVEEQGAATEEIARNVQQATVGTQDVTTNILGVDHAAKKTGDSANRVQRAAREVNQQTDRVRRLVVDFLDGVRAA